MTAKEAKEEIEKKHRFIKVRSDGKVIYSNNILFCAPCGFVKQGTKVLRFNSMEREVFLKQLAQFS